jgi:hypothetical protein
MSLERTDAESDAMPDRISRYQLKGLPGAGGIGRANPGVDKNLDRPAAAEAGAAEPDPDPQTVAIVTIHIGRKSCFEPWKDWLMTVSLPLPASVYLVDNSADGEFGDLLSRTVGELHGTARFRSVSLLRGGGPALSGDRSDRARFESTAQALTLAIAATQEEFVLIVDDDTIPDSECLEKLLAEFNWRRAIDETTAAISGCYESARAPGILVAARSMEKWADRPRVGELRSDDVIEVGFAGHGCLLIAGDLVRDMLPIGPERSDRNPGGPDDFICRRLRAANRSLWLHGGVQCRHLFERPPASR